MISIVYVICEFAERPMICEGRLHGLKSHHTIPQRGMFIKAVYSHGEVIMCLDCGIDDLTLRRRV